MKDTISKEEQHHVLKRLLIYAKPYRRLFAPVFGDSG
jgi:hypothetical protein